MRIDVHAHFWTGNYLDLLVDLGNDPQIDTIAARAILDQNASALLGIG